MLRECYANAMIMLCLLYHPMFAMPMLCYACCAMLCLLCNAMLAMLCLLPSDVCYALLCFACYWYAVRCLLSNAILASLEASASVPLSHELRGTGISSWLRYRYLWQSLCCQSRLQMGYTGIRCSRYGCGTEIIGATEHESILGQNGTNLPTRYAGACQYH